MTLMNIRKHLMALWRRYGTMNNIVIVVGLLIAASWAWGSISAMQRNFALQREADEQRRQLELVQLEVDTRKFQQNYYKSDEYKDLAARMYLGLAGKDEKVLILPPNSATAKHDDASLSNENLGRSPQPSTSNLDQWLGFLLGNNANTLQK